MKKLLCVLSLSMIVLLTSASISYSDTYKIIQITNNEYNDAYPQINAEGDVVWHGQTSSNISDYDSLEIFYYDTSEETTSQITTNTYRDLTPRINASGDVVWHGVDVGGYFEIFLYDGSTTTQLTSSTEQDNFSPQINANGDVVWNRRPFQTNTDYYQVFFYDRSSETESMLPSSQYGLSPQINAEGHVVWYNEHDYKGIHLYDGSETILLSSSTTNLDKSPQINPNGDVVWDGYDGTNSEIFLYDGLGLTTIQLTNNDYFDTNPKINESGDVVWRGYDGTDYEIYYYDRSSGVTTQLTDNHYDDGYPQINANGEVVWHGKDSTDSEIFLYDGSTTIQLTDNDYDDFSPQINANSEVVWHGGYYESNYLIGEIFLARPAAVDVNIDIKPGSDPNCFNNDGHGVIPVAILGSEDFDCTQVDPSTCILSGMVVKAVGKSNKFLAHIEDFNNDGYSDLVLQIEDQDGVFEEGETEATLIGNLYAEYGGASIEGSDFICIVP